MIFLYLAAALGVLYVLARLHFARKHGYWRRRHLDHPPPSFPFGNVQNSYGRTASFGEQLGALYRWFRGRGCRHGGLYLMSNPAYMPVEPELIKRILIADFAHFVDRGIYINTRDDPLSAHLIALRGDRWKRLRARLTPTFTSGKLRTMFGTLRDCSRSLVEMVNAEVAVGGPVDIKEVTGRYTTDVIGCCAFGLEFNAIRDDDSPFRLHGKRIFRRSRMRNLRSTLAINFPNLARRLGVRAFPKDTADFFLAIVRETVEYRELHGRTRDDFLQLLIDLKNDQLDGLELTVEDVAAQCFVFFLAGFETSATTLSFLMYELALHPRVQDRAREEVRRVVGEHDGELTYQALMEMKYLSQVIDETMRKYPAVSFLSRECVKDYQVPDTDLVIEKGTRCLISLMGLHYDDEYYPNPEEFDPDRFSEENRHSRHPYAYLPFGDGPRNCIGSRFGLLQTKLGVAVLLTNYEFALNPVTQCPIQLSPNSLVTTPKYGIWLDAKKL